MVDKKSFVKAMKLINTEANHQDELWDRLEDGFINVDKLISQINISPMIEMLAGICDCPFEVIADNVYGSYDSEAIERLYDYISGCDKKS